MSNINARTNNHTIDFDHATGRVSISDLDNHWVGSGRWRSGRVVDCAAALGDEEWDAIDDAIADAIDDHEDEAGL